MNLNTLKHSCHCVGERVSVKVSFWRSCLGMGLAFLVKMPIFYLDESWRGGENLSFLVYVLGQRGTMNSISVQNSFPVNMIRDTEQ